MNNNQNVVEAKGLTRFYGKVYGFLGLGIGISALTAYLCINVFWSQIAGILSGNSLVFWAIWIAQLVLVFSLSKNAFSDSGMSLIGYVAYSVLTGITLSVTVAMYTQQSVVSAFVTAAGTFAAMSVVGMVTKKDLSAIGHALYSLVLGIIIASLLNIFILKSGPVDFFISLVMVVVFAGLTAYDNQKIKTLYASNGGQASTNLAVYCALSLYLDLINLFYAFLRLFNRN
ncbi:Bax inhibitor-1/YccA family protein [Vagococcus sp.]|uniref:Bax inhibitor-1/YccA family protein n=1 Tax=Vagococcus sp. TaxID=1933889 RepID=UPI003F9AE139